jgi:hypothetical protein
VHEKADDDISVYLLDTKRTVVARYTDELNESITLPDGAEWALEDGGYALRVGPDEVWHRADEDVPVCVDASVREGVIPMLERTLKLQRKAAKKKLAQVEEMGDQGLIIFLDNLQQGATRPNPNRMLTKCAGFKLLMNALYGGLGTGKGCEANWRDLVRNNFITEESSPRAPRWPPPSLPAAARSS